MSLTDQRYSATLEIRITGHRLALFPARGPDYSNDPEVGWAILAYLTIRMRWESGRVRSKQLRAAHRWETLTGWPRLDRPSDDEISEARTTVLEQLRDECQLHGFDPGELDLPLEEEPDRPELTGGF